MFERMVVAGVLILAAAMPADLAACGDKFLVPSRGLRFQAPIDREAAAILLYGPPGSVLNATLANPSLEAMLRRVGYRPTIVTTREAFDTALLAGGWDVVVLDLAAAGDGLPGGAPLVLPVVHDVARATMDAAKKQYRQVLRSPARPQAFVEAIDKLIVARAKARAKSASRTGD